ncbi:MAG: protein kinase [Planctomycetota bacterium]
MTQGLDTALARWLHQEGLLDARSLQGCLAEVRQRRWADPDVSLALVLVDRRLVPPERLHEGLTAVVGPQAGAPAAALASSSHEFPERFGPFRVLRELAQGGMGAVLEVVHEQSGVRYALKTIKPSRLRGTQRAEAEEELARFRREAELTARLDHPHVVRIHGADLEARGYPYLVQDLLPGGTLAERIEAQGALEPQEALEVALKLALALQHAHARGVLHRDLKPGNVMFDDRGEPRLVDWGLARSVREASLRLTEDGTILGTPGYMPPEQATGDEEAGPPADAYALGALLFAMLCGRPPFQGERALAVLDQVLHQPPPRLRALRRDLPAREGALLEDLIDRALAKAPADRPSLAEMGEVLNRLARDEGGALVLAPRRRGAAVAGALALLLGLAALGVAGVARLRRARDDARRVELAQVAELTSALDLGLTPAPGEARGLRRLRPTSPAELATLRVRLEALAGGLAPAEEARRAELLSRVGEHERLARACAGEAVPLGGAGALGDVVDGLVLQARGDLSGAARAARRALVADRGSLPAWRLALELADEAEQVRLVEGLAGDDPAAVRALAAELLRPTAIAALSAFPARAVLDEAQLRRARRPLAALAGLGASRAELARVVADATNAAAPRWAELLAGTDPTRLESVLAALASLGPEPLPLGAALRARLRELVRAGAVAIDEVSRELAGHGTLGPEGQRRRGRARADLLRGLRLDAALTYRHAALAPGWESPVELVSAATHQVIVETRGRSDLALDCTLLVLRAGTSSSLDPVQLAGRVQPADAAAWLARVPGSRAGRLLVWRHGLQHGAHYDQLPERELIAAYEALRTQVVEPAPGTALDDLTPGYLGSAELWLAEMAGQLGTRDGPAAAPWNERAVAWAERAASRPLPHRSEQLARVAEVEGHALGQLRRVPQALERSLALVARLRELVAAAPPEEQASCRWGLGRSLYQVGRWRYQLGRYEEALLAFDEVVDSLRRGSRGSDREGEARAHASRCLYRLGRREEAWQKLELDARVIELGGSYEAASWALELTKEVRGPARAQALLEELLSRPPREDEPRIDGAGRPLLNEDERRLLREDARRFGLKAPEERP